MSLALSEEQELLKNTAREFLSENSPVKELRRLRDAQDPVGFSRSPAAPAVRATTTSWSATCPSRTKVLLPRMR